MSRPATAMLEEQFGLVYADVLLQTPESRIVCTRSEKGDVPLAVSFARINEETASLFAEQHARIVAGGLLGQVFTASEVPFTRDEFGAERCAMPLLLQKVFGDAVQQITVKKVPIFVGRQQLPYADIIECSASDVALEMDDQHTGLADEIFTLVNDPALWLIAPLRESELEAFLRLAHGFLKKTMHVGIAEEG